MFAPLFALFAKDMGAGAFQVGIAYSINMSLAGLLIILVGGLEDKIKHKETMIVIGYFWLAGAAFLYLLVDDLASLYMVQALNAIGTGILFPAWKAVYARSRDKGREASKWSLYDGGNMIVTALAALAGGYIVSQTGFRMVFVLMALIQIVAALSAFRLLLTKRGRMKRTLW